MSLADHLRELRYRVIIASLGIVAASALAAIFYNQLYLLLMRPYLIAVEMLKESNPNLDTSAVISGVGTPLALALQVCLVSGLVLSSPLWLYQLWAFIAPALLAKEKKYALLFVGIALPLFLLGVLVGYYILPQGISVLLAFTPSSVPVTNLLAIDEFLKFTLQLMVVFGLGFLMPVVVVGLNLMGVVSAKQLGKARTYVIFGTFIFGAAATPSTDPFSMLALALPMTVLYLIAEAVSRANDRRKAKLATAEAG
ncbi:MAG TPA: twin-arginine translocase subunit TatC [Propionicimonas sp.]|nr:twin-arginine translocase subunit TatC [Propionicimonas sp.]HRA06899.1 twin-arginine translocase subunit TatC [Propionicimonas sp.]